MASCGIPQYNASNTGINHDILNMDCTHLRWQDVSRESQSRFTSNIYNQCVLTLSLTLAKLRQECLSSVLYVRNWPGRRPKLTFNNHLLIKMSSEPIVSGLVTHSGGAGHSQFLGKPVVVGLRYHNLIDQVGLVGCKLEPDLGVDASYLPSPCPYV